MKDKRSNIEMILFIMAIGIITVIGIWISSMFSVYEQNHPEYKNISGLLSLR